MSAPAKLGKGFVKGQSSLMMLNQKPTSAAGARKLVAGRVTVLNRVYETSTGGHVKTGEQTEKFERSLNEVYVTSALKRAALPQARKTGQNFNQAYARFWAEAIVHELDLDESLNTV